MTIYLGSKGRIELQRMSSKDEITVNIRKGDIDASKRRFSLDFPHGTFSTGDEIEIRTSGDYSGQNIKFIAASAWPGGARKSKGQWFINVDALDGIRLYDTWMKAVNGVEAQAFQLDYGHATKQELSIKHITAIKRVLGQIESYELNTNREAVDMTTLGNDFRTQYSSLISGSGRVVCYWDYKDTIGGGEYEVSQYLAQLAIRSEIGSTIQMDLFVKAPGYNPSGVADEANDVVWYEVYAVLTGSAIQFDLNGLVKMTADFVTKGSIRLKVATEVEYNLLKEDLGAVLIDRASGVTTDILLLE